MSDKIWNGGTTNKSKEKAIREWNKLIRDSEDYYDEVDSETTFREDLVEREKLMREEAKYQKIQSKYSLSNGERRINKDMDKPTKITGMGGKGGPVQAIKSRNKK
tara:strand:- start:366 stop:680 length:315 start_codon:yes stop_codon:yes gene_type:complete